MDSKEKYFFIFLTIFIPFLGGYQIAVSQDLNAGLIAKYNFSGNPSDEIGTNDGINHGAQLSKDRFGNTNSAYYFDGSGVFIEIPDNDLLDFEYNENFSISLWVNIASVQNDMRGHNNEILGKWNALRSSGYPYAIRYWNENASEENKNKIFDLRYDTESCGHNPLITGRCSIPRNEWHHLAYIKNGSVLSYYQDGQLFGTTVDNTISSCNTVNNNPIYIGKRDLETRYFTGLIDDISFYNRALTPVEVVLLVSNNGWIVPSSPDTDMLSFSIPNQVSSTFDFSTMTIEVIMPCSSDLSQLVASFTVSDGSKAYINDVLQFSSSSANDFSLPVMYTVSNSDYCNHSDWVINVKHQTFSQDYIEEVSSFLSFSLEGQISVSINNNNHTINVLMPCYADLTKLIATFSLENNSMALLNDKLQTSGGITNDFTNTVTYTIINSETCSEQKWDVLTTIQTFSQDYIDSATSFDSYAIFGQTQPTEIDTSIHQIKLYMPCGTDLSNLKSSFSIANGSTTEINGIEQESGITIHDFSSTQSYLIISQDGCYTSSWDVKVSVDQLDFEAVDFTKNEYYVPNVITPNSDGKNDFFKIGELFQESDVKIFNRNGIKVFESYNYRNQFSGSELASGVYYYWIKTKCLEEPIKGPVSILK